MIDDLVTAIDYADVNNIPILNLSLRTTRQSISELQTAVTNYSGLMICAAGNDAIDIDNGGAAPACLSDSHIISIGASTSADGRCTFSNYGDVAVDLFAPGDSILSSYPRSLCSATNCTKSGHLRYGYHLLSGTSMAAPFVTGVAALIMAHNPNVTRNTIKNIILGSVDICDSLDGYCRTDGRLNALNALS